MGGWGTFVKVFFLKMMMKMMMMKMKIMMTILILKVMMMIMPMNKASICLSPSQVDDDLLKMPKEKDNDKTIDKEQYHDRDRVTFEEREDDGGCTGGSDGYIVLLQFYRSFSF